MRFKSADRLHAWMAALGVRTSGPPLQRAFCAALSAGFFLLTIASCAQAASTGKKTLELNFPHAYTMRGCTQEDAPALEIYVTQSPYTGAGDPSAPYIRFEISSPVRETLPSATFELGPLHRDPAKPGRIVRGEFVDSKESSGWLSGKLKLEHFVPDKQLSGHYDVTLPDGRRLQRSFVAVYLSRTATCG
jgi:hypothetical protein